MSKFDVRTGFVVTGMTVLFFVAWTISLSSLLNIHFYDSKYALQQVDEPHCVSETLGNSTAFCEISASYYQPRRYVWFFPHVLAAFVWWNFYFWQLIPYIRHRFRKFHRYMGRILMLTAIVQVVTGSLLATSSSSSIIKIVSWTLAVVAMHCIARAWTAARAADYVAHKYWAIRLVGYMQTIALQRFFLVAAIVTHQAGWYGLYSPFSVPMDSCTNNTTQDEVTMTQCSATTAANNAIVRSMFDGSFVLAMLCAVLVTEWYLLLVPRGDDCLSSPSSGNHDRGNANDYFENDQEDSLISYGGTTSISP